MHTVPLNSLDGKENLPQKKYYDASRYSGQIELNKGFNQALDEINQCTVGLDEEKMAEIIIDEWYDQLGKNINRGEASRLFAKLIASKPELVIKIGKVK